MKSTRVRPWSAAARSMTAFCSAVTRDSKRDAGLNHYFVPIRLGQTPTTCGDAVAILAATAMRQKQPFLDQSRSKFRCPADASWRVPPRADDAGADQRLDADDAQGKADQDRREGHQTRALRDVHRAKVAFRKFFSRKFRAAFLRFVQDLLNQIVICVQCN
jgi:hypothetical protein